MVGATTGTVKLVLRLEGLAVLLASALAYAQFGEGWLLFALCFFLPDLSLIGYLAGPRTGAIAYNAVHSSLGAIACLVAALVLPQQVPPAVGLVWFAHIGFDRALGYGLKYRQGFGFTHLGLAGRDAKRASEPSAEGGAQLTSETDLRPPENVDGLPRIGGLCALRRLRVADLAAFQAYRADPKLGRYQGWSAMADADAEAFLRAMRTVPLFRPGEWSQIGIAAPQPMALLGDIGLFLAEDSREAEIGVTLARAAQGRGIATEAVSLAVGLIFARTAVSRVCGITDARNHASIRLLERVGMRRHEERDAIFRGEPCVEFVYAVEREEFDLLPQRDAGPRAGGQPAT